MCIRTHRYPLHDLKSSEDGCKGLTLPPGERYLKPVCELDKVRNHNTGSENYKENEHRHAKQLPLHHHSAHEGPEPHTDPYKPQEPGGGSSCSGAPASNQLHRAVVQALGLAHIWDTPTSGDSAPNGAAGTQQQGGGGNNEQDTESCPSNCTSARGDSCGGHTALWQPRSPQ